jgi:hypothetical protein
MKPVRPRLTGFFLQVPPDGQMIQVRYGDRQEGELRERFARTKILPLPKGCGERR